MREKITRKRLVLLAAAAAAALAVAVPAALAGTTVINASLSPGDTQQTDRLFRDGVPSTCNWFYSFSPFDGPKADPGIVGDGLLRAADVYSFTNFTNQVQCVTVRLSTLCGPFDPDHQNGFAAAYFFYNPDLSALDYEYAGDPGLSGSPMQFGFIAFPFESFEVVVSTVDIDLQNCNNYTLTVQIGKTARASSVGAAGGATAAKAAAVAGRRAGAVDK